MSCSNIKPRNRDALNSSKEFDLNASLVLGYSFVPAFLKIENFLLSIIDPGV